MSEPQTDVNSIPADAHILDVREDDEFNAGHIDGALHIPLGDLAERYAEIPVDEDVYVICRSGGRSQRAVTWLNANGFDAINVQDGMGAWHLDNGKPITAADPATAWVN